MITYLFNLFNLFTTRKNDSFDRTNFHRIDRYSGSHYMLGYLKQNAFKNEDFHDPKTLIPILKTYTNSISGRDIKTNDAMREFVKGFYKYYNPIVPPSNIDNQNIDDYRYMTQIFWSEILEEPRRVLPHPHEEWKIKQTGYCPRDPIKEMHEFLTLNWAIEMAYQKSKVWREDLQQPLIYDLVLKEIKESCDIETINSIETFQDIIWNNVSAESGKF